MLAGNTHIRKVSVSLQRSLYEFVDDYQIAQQRDSRSAVINEAVMLLQQLYLENCYKEIGKEVDDAFETTTFDGLEDETW
jgi:antitoxin ParD1/3/4